MGEEQEGVRSSSDLRVRVLLQDGRDRGPERDGRCPASVSPVEFADGYYPSTTGLTEDIPAQPSLP